MLALLAAVSFAAAFVMSLTGDVWEVGDGIFNFVTLGLALIALSHVPLDYFKRDRHH